MERPLDDPFRRIDYRRSIAWPARIEREWPLLSSILEVSPTGPVLDLGCGTGEHCLFLASKGHRAIGIDRSPSQIEAARDYEDRYPGLGPHFLDGDLERLTELTDERFALAVSLGNVLPSLDDAAFDAALSALSQRMLAGGRLLVQLLNYERILSGAVRHLPINFREGPDGEGEIVFLRILRPGAPGKAWFYPTSLHLRPGQDPPLVVESSREVEVRAWRWPELQPHLARHGFVDFEVWGDVQREPFDPDRSHDLVFAARWNGLEAPR